MKPRDRMQQKIYGGAAKEKKETKSRGTALCSTTFWLCPDF